MVLKQGTSILLYCPPKWYAHPLSPSFNREGLESLANTFGAIV